MGDGTGPGAWSLAASLLGSGVVVVPPLVAAGSVPAAIALTAAGCAGMVLAGVLFVRRPFGGWPARSVLALPFRWRLVYAVGFTGGSGYFAASAAVLLTVGTPLPFWPALALVLVAAAALSVGPAIPGALKTTGAIVAALVVPLSTPVALALGPDAAGRLPVLTALAGTALLAVGWESAAARHAALRPVLGAAVVCCLVFVCCTVWTGPLTHGGRPGRTAVAVLVALVLTVFLSGNLRAIATFCAPSGPCRLRLAAALPILAAVGLQQSHFARGWLLLLPALATLALYTGYAVGRPLRTRQPAEVH